MRRSLILISLLTAALLTTFAAASLAGKTGHEKVPSGEWPIVEDGAWGKMRYRLSGSEFNFVFNGHDLEPGWDYTLIYYPDPWPGDSLICLGSGVANDSADVHIMGRVDTGDLPADYDENAGAKIWLVLTADVDCDSDPTHMVGWNPTEYLFEFDLITFDDTDQ
jgi:hypothetical protein